MVQDFFSTLLKQETKEAASMTNIPRLPPGQYWEGKLPVLDLGTRPLVDRRDWRLTVAGRVARPLIGVGGT